MFLAAAALAVASIASSSPGPGLNDAVRMQAAVQYNAVIHWNEAEAHNRMVASRPRRPPEPTRPRATTGGSSSWDSVAQSIRRCESGNDYTAMSADGRYGGAYQFDEATWRSVGGTGQAKDASPNEQDMRAEILYARAGSSPWPVCGR